jgi:hypothetical protein
MASTVKATLPTTALLTGPPEATGPVHVVTFDIASVLRRGEIVETRVVPSGSKATMEAGAST